MTFEAVLLLATVVTLTGVVKNLAAGAIPGGLPSWATPLVAIAIGIATVFLVAETDWADKQIVNDLPLDSINGWSKVVAGIYFGGLGGLTTNVIKKVGDIGENHATTDRTID
jgi:hypothetical protein